MRFSILFAVAWIVGLGYACISSDSVIVAMSSYPATASAFCSQYIQPTYTTILVIPTTTTTTVVSTFTPETTLIETFITFIIVTTDVVVTSTTVLYPPPNKRNLLPRSVFVPLFLTQFSPVQISSGCTCFIKTMPSPTYTTITTADFTATRDIVTTYPTETITTYTISTETVTTTQTITTVVPYCAPISGNSSSSAASTSTAS